MVLMVKLLRILCLFHSRLKYMYLDVHFVLKIYMSRKCSKLYHFK